MKMDGRLGRNPLKGSLGDALHAVMCGAGQNLRLILAALRLYCARIGLSMQAVVAALIASPTTHRPACGRKRNCSGWTNESARRRANEFAGRGPVLPARSVAQADPLPEKRHLAAGLKPGGERDSPLHRSDGVLRRWDRLIAFGDHRLLANDWVACMSASTISSVLRARGRNLHQYT